MATTTMRESPMVRAVMGREMGITSQIIAAELAPKNVSLILAAGSAARRVGNGQMRS